MDSLITAAARALAAGDPLGALKRVALRDDAAALALRGIAMAQLGDFALSRSLLRRAARAFGANEPVARARCIVAEAEVALVSRDLVSPSKNLVAARDVLADHGDRVNAAHARYLEIRCDILAGSLDDAQRKLDDSDPTSLPPALEAGHELLVAGIALRRIRTGPARAALARAIHAARRSGIPALIVEAESARRALEAPAALLKSRDETRPVLLEEVEALFASGTLIVDACRHAVRAAGDAVSLARRPVLFALARALAEAWPADVPRETLGARVFRLNQADESLRARLRVEIGRLRKALHSFADVRATARGFELVPSGASNVVLLARPMDDEHAGVLALLADGESWSSSGLALALGASQRTVQRTLATLAEAGKVQCFGRGRARRWMSPPGPGFATTLLLPVSSLGD